MSEEPEEQIDTPEGRDNAAEAATETTAEPAANSTNRTSRTATVAHYLLMLAIILMVASPLTYRTGILDMSIALPLLPAGLVVALLAMLVGIAGIVTTRSAAGRGKALTALVGGAIIATIVAVMVLPSMLTSPAIHDIPTNMEDPPAFVALKAARDAAPNETDYAGGEVSAMQAVAYPALQTYVTAESGNTVFAAAQDIVASMGWKIAIADQNGGTIEATATTRIYGYKDDVVIRIRPTMEGTTEVDVRSASRVGLGDLGANAARITSFLTALDSALTS